MDEKIDYVHDNPVEAGLVFRAEDYLYSSAADYAGEKGILDDVVVIRYSCKCHAIQSRGSGDWFSGLRIIYLVAQQIMQERVDNHQSMSFS
jgi:hypothetical protein